MADIVGVKNGDVVIYAPRSEREKIAYIESLQLLEGKLYRIREYPATTPKTTEAVPVNSLAEILAAYAARCRERESNQKDARDLPVQLDGIPLAVRLAWKNAHLPL